MSPRCPEPAPGPGGGADTDDPAADAERRGEGGGPSSSPPQPHPQAPPPRARPTNNQLLYRAHFRWDHWRPPGSMRPPPVAAVLAAGLPASTEPCASVTSAFLRVIRGLADAEDGLRSDFAHHSADGHPAAGRPTAAHLSGPDPTPPRNILRLLSEHTRRTKVVELSSRTHRVPDELRRHTLVCRQGGQYSTNLDRNRYGGDDHYLTTVVRHDLTFLGLCPRLVEASGSEAKGGGKGGSDWGDWRRCRPAPPPPRGPGAGRRGGRRRVSRARADGVGPGLGALVLPFLS